MDQKKTPVVIRKVGDSHAVWFSASQSFVLFEDPAWDVFRLRATDTNITDIIKYIHLKYGGSKKNVSKFAKDVIAGIDKFTDPENRPYKPPESGQYLNRGSENVYSKKSYEIQGRSYTFLYDQELLYQCFHPLLAGFDKKGRIHADGIFRLSLQQGLFVFRYNGKIAEVFRESELPYLKGAVFQKLLSLIHNVRYDGWMMTFHASGVTDGKSVVLFSAGAGLGKSTLAALMQANGYSLVADDFIPVAKKTGKAYSFPGALSVKEGSWKVLAPWYPGLLNGELPESGFLGKRIRHLPVNSFSGEVHSYPVKAVVFVRYDAGAGCNIEKIGKKEALREVLVETWVSPTASNVRRFFSWIHRTGFYRLTYSDNMKAVETVQKLFSGEL